MVDFSGITFSKFPTKHDRVLSILEKVKEARKISRMVIFLLALLKLSESCGSNENNPKIKSHFKFNSQKFQFCHTDSQFHEIKNKIDTP